MFGWEHRPTADNYDELWATPLRWEHRPTADNYDELWPTPLRWEHRPTADNYDELWPTGNTGLLHNQIGTQTRSTAPQAKVGGTK